MTLDTANQYVEFGMGQEQYAIPIQDIHEIIRVQEITRLPHTPAFVEGVINLRGKIVPVISLRKRFGFEDIPLTKRTRIIVINRQDEKVGVLVDHVNKVVRIHDMQAPPERLGTLNGTFFEGIGKSDNGLVSVLKLEHLFEEAGS
ncbi:chemotaxis protein CheW [Paenibacillus sp. FSL R7-0297]|uniref:chemotaxis protein CheW n=1 Tax=unclassified Paenibacillus TaxID=185978 RepID=UPI0004F67DC2|nr:chemotaxis protein CheW [Paenibacillus sp. FSL R5-0912]AIQ43779.1 chemotaxis protein CheW [Paenibacillus sp. FSL R5-0912]